MKIVKRIENFIDNAICVFAPIYGQKRKAARYILSYQSALANRLRTDWVLGNSESADSELLPVLDVLRNQSRELRRNNGIISGILNTFTTHIVGHGISYYPQLNEKRLGLSPDQKTELEYQIKKIWKKHSKYLDLTARLHFREIQHLIIRKILEDGEIFLVRHYRERPYAPLGLCFEIVEADRVETPPNASKSKDIRRGIELNKDGEPVKYYILKTHPGDASDNNQEFATIPARDEKGEPLVYHLYWQLRPGQTRGEPWFTPILNLMYDLSRYREAEVVAARIAACFAAFIKSENAPFYQIRATEEEDSKRVEQFYPGMIEYLRPGEDVVVADPKRPNPNLDKFIEQIVREIGASLGLPYELVMKDFSKTNYSSARAAINEAIKLFKYWQVWLIDYFCQPVLELVLEEAWAKNLFPVYDFLEKKDEYCNANWTPPGWRSVDPLKESNAKKTDLMYGTTTLADIAAEEGKDWEELLEQQKREQEKRQELGLEYPMFGGK